MYVSSTINALVLIPLLSIGDHRVVECGTIAEMETLHAALLTGYNKNIRPINDQSASLNVTVFSYLRAIQDLDEVTGVLSFTAGMTFAWNDDKLTWDPSAYGDIRTTYMSYTSVWTPEIIITTTVDTSDTFAKKWMKVMVTSSGSAKITVGGKYMSSCSVDVENYPFDKQTCLVQFTSWGYHHDDIVLIAGKTEMGVGFYSENSIWHLSKTETKANEVQGWSYYDIVFHLERKATFTLLSLLSPLLLLNFLNVLVFVLVPESGERVSFSITVLLAIAVFMTIISDALPPSSDPVPKITYKLMADMVISVLITMITIFNLRLYHRDDDATTPVPGCLQAFYRFFQSCSCFCCSRCCCFGPHRKRKVGFVLNTPTKVKVLKLHLESDDMKERSVSWKQISYMVDYIALVFFRLLPS